MSTVEELETMFSRRQVNAIRYLGESPSGTEKGQESPIAELVL